MPTLDSHLPSIDALYRLAAEHIAPRAELDPWDWAVEHLTMPDGGRFRARLAAPLRYWFRLCGARLMGRPLPGDAASALVEQIYIVAFAQLAKTTTGLVLGCWAARHYPRRIGLYFGRGGDLRKTQRGRLRPMIERTPTLEALLPRGSELREVCLSPLMYQLGSALGDVLSGRVADDWRSEPLKLIIADEIESYPLDVDGEGDPIDLGLVRQRTMPHSRLLLGLTSPVDLVGHGWARLCSGSHQRPVVLCEACQAATWLDHRQIHCLGNPGDGSGGLRQVVDVARSEIRRARCARFLCEHCGALHDDAALRRMVLEAQAADRWIAGTWSTPPEYPCGLWTMAADVDELGRLRDVPPPTGIIRSGHVNALFSAYETLTSFAAKKSAALAGSEHQQKTWWNAEAAEPYLPHIASMGPVDVAQIAVTSYARGSCPVDAPFLVRVEDQQGNSRDQLWFPWIVVAVFPGIGTWRVDAGATDKGGIGIAQEEELDERTWSVGSRHLPCQIVVRDSANPNYRALSYAWASEAPTRRLLMRGDVRLEPGALAVPVISRSTHHRAIAKPSSVVEYRIHPHHWPQVAYDSLTGRGGLAWHMPADMPAMYLRSLTSQEPVVERQRIPGRGWAEVIAWRPRTVRHEDGRETERRDDHWWRCEAMLAALVHIKGWDQSAPAPIPGSDLLDRGDTDTGDLDSLSGGEDWFA